jgi:hypothetical protein
MSDAILAAAERILGWLVTYSVHSTLLLGAAALLGGRVAGSLKGRELLWKVALFGGVATATVQAGVGYVPLGGEWSGATLWGWMAPGSTPGNAPSGPPASGALPVAAAGLVLAWLAVAAVGVARVARSHRRFCRGLHRRPVRDAELLALLDELRAATGFTRPVRLSTSTTCPSPLALGTGEICVPAWFAADLGRWSGGACWRTSSPTSPAAIRSGRPPRSRSRAPSSFSHSTHSRAAGWRRSPNTRATTRR